MEEELEITAKELKRLIDSGTRVTLIDVREQHEHDLCHIDGSSLIPLSNFETASKNSTPAANMSSTAM